MKGDKPRSFEGGNIMFYVKETINDAVEVKVEITDALLGDDTIKTLETLQKRITAAIERIINIRVKVTLVEPRTLERFDGKAKRVKDLRKI